MQCFILLVGLVVSASGAPVKQVSVPEKSVVKAAAVQSKHIVPVPAKPTAKLPVPNLHAKVAAPVPEKPAVKTVAVKAAAPVAEKVAVKAVAVKAAAKKAASPVPEKLAVKLAVKAAAPAKAVPVPEKPSAKLPVPNLHAHAEAKSAKDRGLAEPVSCKRLEACLAQGAGLAEDKEKTKLKTCIQSFCEDMRSQGKNVSNSRVCGDKGKEVMDIIAMANKEKKASLVALKGETYAAVFRTLLAQSDVKQVSDACHLEKPAVKAVALKAAAPVAEKPAAKAVATKAAVVKAAAPVAEKPAVKAVALKAAAPVAEKPAAKAVAMKAAVVKAAAPVPEMFLKAASVQKHADAPKLPEQGYEGKGVKHENMKSITADFGAEYGPTTQKPVVHSGAQGSAIMVAVVVSAIAALV